MKRLPVFTAIVLGALIIRIGVVVFFSPRLDASDITSIDALAYRQIAENLVQEHIFTSAVDPPYNLSLPGTFRPPLTPLYLAFWFQVFWVDILWGRLGLALLSAFSCGLTYYLGKKIFGQSTGIVAGMISLFYPFFLLLVHLPLTEGLSIFLCLMLFSLLHASYAQEKTVKMLLSVGIVLGLLFLNKAANFTIVPCIFLWSFAPSLKSLKKGLLNMGLVTLFATLTIFPWTVRNYAITGIFIPVNSNGGWTLYLGNNTYTEKNLDALEQGRSNGWVPPKEVFLPFSDLEFTDIGAWEARSVQLAWRFITDHPEQFLQLAYRKLKIFWSPYNHRLDKLTWIPIMILSLFGLCLSVMAWRKHLLLYLQIVFAMLIPVFFTSMPRFRAPIMPLLILYSAFALVHLFSYGRRLLYANRY